MGLLQGLFFANDRQVHYLEAYRYKNDGDKSKLYIEIERFTTYKQKLHYYFKFKDQFDVDSPSDRNVETQEDLLAVLNVVWCNDIEC